MNYARPIYSVTSRLLGVVPNKVYGSGSAYKSIGVTAAKSIEAAVADKNIEAATGKRIIVAAVRQAATYDFHCSTGYTRYVRPSGNFVSTLPQIRHFHMAMNKDTNN